MHKKWPFLVHMVLVMHTKWPFLVHMPKKPLEFIKTIILDKNVFYSDFSYQLIKKKKSSTVRNTQNSE